jgi:hypothetical protein
LGALWCSIIVQIFFTPLSEAFGQSRQNKRPVDPEIAATAKFEDNFNSGTLSASWAAHIAFKVQNGQLVNSAAGNANDHWDHFLAIAKTITSPDVAKIVYGSLSDPTARAFTGIAIRLQKADTLTDGYMIHHYFDRVRLWTLNNGAPDVLVDELTAARAEPDVDDTLTVEFTTDDAGHHFRVLINGKEDAVLNDANKLQGNSPTNFAGVIVNGNLVDGTGKITNGIDYFFAARTVDTVPPGAVSDLAAVSASASAINLSWKAPGDDDNIGTAKSYDLRYSTSPINDANFGGATPASAVPAPAKAGTVQNATVSGLNSGTTYYFALKTKDAAGNESGLSNVAIGTTITVNLVVDNFNRPGPELGTRWKADPTLKIVSGAVQNVTPPDQDIWSIAVFDAVKSPAEVSLKWGPNATPYGTNWCGLLVMATGQGATTNGYMIQYSERDSKTRLWHVKDGAFAEVIEDLTSVAPPPKAGSVMRVAINSDANGHHFQVYIDDQSDVVLNDPGKVEGASGTVFAGFVQESTLNEENAIDEFSAAVTVGSPAKLEADASTNNQIGSIGEQLPNPLRVTVTDSTGNPVPNVPITFKVTEGEAQVLSPPSPDGNLRIEAEFATIVGQIEIREIADASGGRYIVYPNGVFEDASAALKVNITQAGTYRIWTRSFKMGSDPGSWTMQVDGGADFTYDVFRGSLPDNWQWDLLAERGSGSPSSPEFDPKTFDWQPGEHTIIFKARYSDTWLDKIIVTSDPAFVPSGREEMGFATDKNGVSSAIILLGQKAGKITIQAQYGTLAPAIFTATATGGKAAKIELTSGNNNQTGAAGQQLAQPFVVTVRDGNDNPVANYAVDWVVVEGNGKLTTYRSITGLNGQTQTFLILGNQSPSNKVEARVALTNAPIAFTATTISGVAATASIVSGNVPQQSATVRTALPNPLVAKVADGNGAGVANYPVEFASIRGGGTASAVNRVANPGFESVINGTVAPSNWKLEGTPAPTLSEVQVSTAGPRSGSRSLNVIATRSGVGVSQAITYPANSSFTLSFYAKVTSGTARVTWQMGQDQIIDMTPATTKNDWQFYTIYANSGATAGAKTLSFKTNGSGNFFIDDVKILPNTGANGQASITWTMGDTAMVQQGQVRVLNSANGNLSGSPLNFSATAKAGAAAVLAKVSGDNQAGAANQPLPAPFVVRVSDITGINSVGNVSVTFQVIAGGGKLPGNLTTQNVTTNANGQASTTLTLGPQTGVPNKVKVSAAGVAKPDTFTAIAAIPGRIAKGTGAPTIGSAGKKVAAPLTVQVFDTNNKRIAGFPVTFTIKAGGGSINGGASAVIPTNANGEAQAFPVLGPNPGAQNRIEASVTHNGQQVTNSPLAFIVTAARLKTLSYVSGNNQPPGVVSTPLPQPIKVKILDSLGAAIKDQNVIFTVSAGNGKVNGTTPVTVKTDSLGIASAIWTLGPQPGTNNNRVQASTNPALTGSPIIFQASATAGVPSKLVKVSRDSVSSVVKGTMPLTAKVTDVGGNPKADVNVVFTIKSGGGKVNGAATATVKSQANGQATVTLTLGPTAGFLINVIEVSAQFNSKPLTGSPLTYRITGTSSKAASLGAASGNRQTGQAGEKLPKQIMIKVQDASGNGVVNHPVTFRVTRGEGHFGTPNTPEILVQSDATGFAKVNWYLGPVTKPDSQIVLATSTDGVNNLKNVPFKFVAFANPGPPNSEASFVQAIPSTIQADGVARCQVKVYVRDRYGNGIKGVPVTLVITGEGVKISQPAEPTDANGIAQGSFTATRAETKTVTAKVISVPPVDISRGAAVKVTPLTAQSLIQSGGNGQTGNVNTALPAPLTVKAGDKFGNGVPGYEVRYKVEQGGGKLQDPFSGELLDSLRVRTDEEGFAKVVYVCGPSTVENQIRVSASGLLNSPLLYLAQVKNAPAAKIEIVEDGNHQVGTVGATLAKPIAVKVMDNSNRPVSGVPVRFSISLGDGTINEQSSFIVNSDHLGEAKGIWRLGPEAGLNVLRAEASGLAGSPIDFEAQALPDRATVMRFIGNGIVFGNVNGQSEPLTVQVIDGLGNGVAGIGVIFELVEGTGRVTENFVVSGDGGYAAVKVVFDAKSGPRKVRASSEGLSGSPLMFTAYAQPLGAVSIAPVPRSNNQSGTKGMPANFPLQVKVLDGLNNPVSGVQVQFVVTSGGGNFNGNGFATAVSDSAGIASALWTLGASAGANQAKANKNGLAGSPVVFNATAFDNNFPIFGDVADVYALENDIIRFKVSASDADGDPINYSALSVPAGASFDLQTRTFTWQTDLNSAGRYEVSFFARDNRGGVDEEVVIIDIANRNQPPIIQRQVPADRGFTVADTVIKNGNVAGKFTMRIFATDPDQDKLSYRWYRDGAFTGVFASSYEFAYNAVSQSSFYNVEALVFDSYDTVRVSWSIQVPVELSSFSATVMENQRVRLSWKTGSERDNAGFNVLRGHSANDKYEKLNAKLIPARRDGEYEFVDDGVDAGGRYYYKLESIDLAGRAQLHGPVMVVVSAPQSFELSQNYPNPFNPSTNIRFELPKAAMVTLSVYNSLGQEVRRLVNAQKPAGYYTIVWNGRDQQGKPVPSGIYHYRIQAGDFVATRKMVLAK